MSMPGWADIEAAPKDYTRVLVCDPLRHVQIAKCLNGWWYDDANGRLPWQPPLKWMPLPSAWVPD